MEKKGIEKKDTKNSIKYDAKNNNKPDIELATSDVIKAHIIGKQKLLKQRYKSLLETKKTIKNNIDLIYTALKKLPKESQSKLTELVKLDTILGDSINVIWREICERDKKGIKKIDVNIEMLYKARNEAIKSYDHYSLMMSEAKTKSEQNNTTKGTGLKIFTTKQMLQRLPIALAQVKAGNNSQNLLNEIRQNIYSLYQSKEITKSIQQLNKIFIKMDTIFMNSESSKTSEPHILKLKLTDKLDSKLDKR